MKYAVYCRRCGEGLVPTIEGDIVHGDLPTVPIACGHFDGELHGQEKAVQWQAILECLARLIEADATTIRSLPGYPNPTHTFPEAMAMLPRTLRP